MIISRIASAFLSGACRVLAIAFLLGTSLGVHPRPATGEPATDGIDQACPDYGPPGTLVRLILKEPSPIKGLVVVAASGATRKVPLPFGPSVFAMPDLPVGDYRIIVVLERRNPLTGENRKESFPFRVQTDPPRSLTVEDIDLGAHRAVGVLQPQFLELTVYGLGFDLDSGIIVDNHTLASPLVPDVGRFDESSHPLRLPSLKCGGGCCEPPSSLERVRTALLPVELATAGEHEIKITRLEGGHKVEASKVFRLPGRSMLVKIDHPVLRHPSLLPTIADFDFPLVVRKGEPITIRRVLSDLGYRLDLFPQPEITFDFSADDFRIRQVCTDSPKAPAFFLSDVVDFARQHGSPVAGELAAGELYIHASILSSFISDNRFTALGLHVNGLPGVTLDHRESVLFAFAGCTNENRLRTFIHEMGHALGLSHCDGDAHGITLMNQGSCLDQDNWRFLFSERACSTLRTTTLLAEPNPVSVNSGDEFDKSCCLKENGAAIDPTAIRATSPSCFADDGH
jgi:hypothetical protein